MALAFGPVTLTARAYSDPQSVPSSSQAERSPDADTRLYIEQSPDQLIKSVPRLRAYVPTESQHELRAILERTGERVDDFFRHVTDLAAHEDISLARVKQDYPSSSPQSSTLQVSDSYLILRQSAKGRNDIREYRTGAKGENFDGTVVEKGFMVTSGFALVCNYFSTAFQPESNFRVLGGDTVDGRDAYVVAFAQMSDANLTITVRSRSGSPIDVLVQGIAWIDKSNYQIVRLRTDLLEPHWDAGLSRLNTEVKLNEVRLADSDVPLWLPSIVSVFMEFTNHDGNADEFFEQRYTNEHRYSDYQRYRAKAKIVP